MQLDAFLRSYQKHVTPLEKVHVLYTSSSYRHERAYNKLFFEGRPSWVVPCRQFGSFKDDLLGLLPLSGSVIFYVDDMMFVRPWTVSEEPGLSLRLGLNITSDYATGNSRQLVPPHTVEGDKVRWKWGDGQLSWSYPLSVDGHVFDAANMMSMARQSHFASPNTFEAALQYFVPSYSERYGTCYRESKVVGIPWNRVQTDWVNRCGEGHDAEDMLGWWEEGKRISLDSIDGVSNESVHQEFPLVLESR